MITGDFDEDGCDDVLVLGVSGKARTYYGQRAKPYFRKGAVWFGPSYGQLGDVPVFVGKHLYVPVLDTVNKTMAVKVYSHGTGSWTFKKTVYLFTNEAKSFITSMRICALGRDINDDKLEDVVLAWSERPGIKIQFVIAEMSPNRIHKWTAIPHQPGHHNQAMVAGLHKSHSLFRRSREFLVTLSSPWVAFSGGFGFMIVDDMKVTKTLWAHMGPSPAKSRARRGTGARASALPRTRIAKAASSPKLTQCRVSWASM